MMSRPLSWLIMSPDLYHGLSFIASFPGPCPAFHCLQYGKAGRAWYLFSREQDVINKWPVLHIVWPTTSSMLPWCVWQSRPPPPPPPPLDRYVAKVTWYLSSSCCSVPQCTHVHLSPFNSLPTLDITHMRKHEKRYQAPCILCATTNGVGLGMRLVYHVNNAYILVQQKLHILVAFTNSILHWLVWSEFMSQTSKLVFLDISFVSIFIQFVCPCLFSIFFQK